MRIFVAGATGVVGRRLVPMLLACGHQVIAMTRSAEKVAALRQSGAEVEVADGLDRSAVRRAVTAASPEVVIHQMTGLAKAKSFRKFDEEFALTNRLRSREPTI
jgi:2-alkyl-3-oxoalkanoate reductase